MQGSPLQYEYYEHGDNKSGRVKEKTHGYFCGIFQAVSETDT